MSSECPEEEDSTREERFILQHNLRPGVPTVRLPRHILTHQPPASQPPLMTPWTDSSTGWQPSGFQPWLSGGPPTHLPLPFMAGPSSHSSHPSSSSHSPSAFTRPGFSTHTPREFLQRPVQPGFDRPLGPGTSTTSSTQIHHAVPEPGEVTIEKCEPAWTPAPPPPPPATPPARQSPPKPSPPARRMRLRDIVSSAVRSALGNTQLDQEAERFNSEIGATFMDALGTTTLVKKEK